eukprot:s1186_g20.t1
MTRLPDVFGPSHAAMLSKSAAVLQQLEAKWLQWRKRPALLQDFLKKLLKDNPILVPIVLKMAAEKGIKVEMGQWEHALQLFDSMDAAIHPTVVTYNSTISSFEKAAQWEQALALFSSMPAKVSPDVITVNATISSCEKAGKWMYATSLLASMSQFGLAPRVITYNAAISSCRKDGEWQIALSLLHGMFLAKVFPDVVSYNACLGVLETAGNWNHALALMKRMEKMAILPNVRSYNATMRSCESSEEWQIALALFHQMLIAEIFPDELSYNAVMGCFRAAEKWREAWTLLQAMPQITLYSSNAALAATAKPGEWHLAMQILQKMRWRRILANVLSYNSAISSCEKSGQWQAALRLLSVMHDASLEATVVTYNAAISCMGKGSEWEQAVLIFSQMCSAQIDPDVTTFGAMIPFVRIDRALQLLETMTQHKLSPDCVSFNAAISSCGYNWMKAMELLEEMISRKIDPDIITYNSLISCLSDALLWQRALVLLKSMEAADLVTRVRSQLRAGLLRWHPDKFEQKFGRSVMPFWLASRPSPSSLQSRWLSFLRHSRRSAQQRGAPDAGCLELLRKNWSIALACICECSLVAALHPRALGVRTQPTSDNILMSESHGPVSHCPIPEHPTILLLNSRPWLYDIQVEKLRDVSDEQLDAALSVGTDVLWLQGCWQLGPYGRQHDLADPGRCQHFRDCLPDFTEDDCIGSPYAVHEYLCNPTLGTEEDLAKFRQRLAAKGVALMVDFVPNHMARDSPWTGKDGLFIKGRNGDVAFGRDPYSGDWTDTAQLNYWSETCRQHMLQELLHLADRCDGMRVDMAMLCVNDVVERTWGPLLREQGFQRPHEEFWVWALPQLRKSHPNFLLVAECYEYDEILPHGTMLELLRQGFSSAYDKVMYDRLSEGHMDKLRGHLYHHPCMCSGKLCHFTENHDEDRSAAHFGPRALAATVASLTLPGPRLVMWGQALGLRQRLAVHLRRAIREAPDAALSSALQGLLSALCKCRGSWQATLPMHGNEAWRLLAWAWKGPGSAAVIAVNYTDQEAWAHIQLHDVLAQAPTDQLQLTDALSGEVFERSRATLCSSEGLVVGLKPFQSHVLLCGW